MNETLTKLMNILTPDAYQVLMLVLFALTVSFCLLFYLQVQKDEKYENSIFSRTYKKKERKNFITDVLLKELRENVLELTLEKGKPIEKANLLINTLLGIVLALSIFMFMMKQPVFAVVLPITLLFVMTKITGLIKKSFSDYVVLQLPNAIETLIRVFSGYDDLKTVLYETSETIPEPMRSIFMDLSRKMQTNMPSSVLQEFMDTNKNIWIYSLCFNLLAYIEDAEKKDVIDNLRELKDIIDRDNKEKKKQKLSRKLTTTINYVLCAMAIAGFILTLVFNKASAVPFFFGTVGGIGCFLGGMSLIVLTIFSNLLIGSGKD